jgi:hypothetical protein
MNVMFGIEVFGGARRPSAPSGRIVLGGRVPRGVAPGWPPTALSAPEDFDKKLALICVH